MNKTRHLSKRTRESPQLATESIRTSGIRSKIERLGLVINSGAGISGTHRLNDAPLYLTRAREIGKLSLGGHE